MDPRSPHPDLTPRSQAGVFRLDETLCIRAMDPSLEILLGQPVAELVGTHVEPLLALFSGDLTPVQAAIEGTGPVAVDCRLLLLPDGTHRTRPVDAQFRIEREANLFLGMTVALREVSAGTESAGRVDPTRSAPSGSSMPGPESSLMEAIERFGSRFEFRAMAAFEVVDGQLERIELWQRYPQRGPQPTAQGRIADSPTRPWQSVELTPAFNIVLNSRASGPRMVEGLDPAMVAALLDIPDEDQDGLSLLGTRLDLPDGPGMLLGARKAQEAQLSLNFNRTLRDLGWLATQLIARRDAEAALTVQLRLQNTLRTVATGFLSIAPNQRSSALRESLWRFGSAVGVRRLMLWLCEPDRSKVRLEAQYSSNEWPIVPAETTVETFREVLRDDQDSTVVFGRDLADLALRTTRSESALAENDRLIVVPLNEGRRVIGFMLAAIGSNARWSAAHTSGLDSLGSLLVSFLARIENEERFDKAFSDGPIPVTWRRPTGELIRCNPAFLDFIGSDSAYALLGSKPEALLDTGLLRALLGEDGVPVDDGAGRAVDSVAEGVSPELAVVSLADLESTPRELPFKRLDGTVAWGRVVSFRVRHGADAIILSHIEDITASREMKQRLQHQANHDELTGLSNRRGLLDELDTLLGDGFETPAAAVLLIDVDRFKVVNDSLGHAAGDELLLILAGRLSSVLQPGDMAARLGGDEFVVVLRGPIEETAARAMAENLLARLSGSVELGPHEVYTSISVGIAFPHPGDTDASDVLRHADAAMYEAKKNGRNCYAIFDQRTRSEVAFKSSVEAELRRALENGDFIPHYQPEYDLVDGSIVSVEALVRWPHPTRGILSAGEIVPLAEETGLIADMGALILDSACHAVASWQEIRPEAALRLRANISASQLQDFQLIDTVVGSLMSSGLRAEHLCLEVTETALMRDPKQALRILNILVREIGVSIAVDDFGTGFSSLAYLKRLPVQTLKIDREFIHELEHNAENLAIVKTIVALAESLRLEVVAEGIEDAATVAELVKLGVTRGQGFHLARPQDRASMEALLRRATRQSGLPSQTQTPRSPGGNGAARGSVPEAQLAGPG